MSDGSQKLLSIVVPVYNERENIEPLYEKLTMALLPLANRYSLEFLFTDNHSTDGSFEALECLARRDLRIRVLRFSRNFGFQRSVLVGYTTARGAAAIQLDCDLQDPPQLIPEFVRKWEEGYQVVYGVRVDREEGWRISTIRKLFYRIIDFLSEDHLPHDAGDFRLLDRCVLEELKKIEDCQPYIRGTVAVLGFNQTGIPYRRSARVHGKSKFSPAKLVSLALDGILNHSIVPLRISTYLGLTVSLLTFLGIIFYVVEKFLFGKNWPPGFATLSVLVLLSISLNAVFLGIVGEYLGRIYQQVKKQPRVVIEREINSCAAARAAHHC